MFLGVCERVTGQQKKRRGRRREREKGDRGQEKREREHFPNNDYTETVTTKFTKRRHHLHVAHQSKGIFHPMGAPRHLQMRRKPRPF